MVKLGDAKKIKNDKLGKKIRGKFFGKKNSAKKNDGKLQKNVGKN